MRWFYSNADTREIYVSNKNNLVTQPYTYNGIKYGTRYNPVYKIGQNTGGYLFYYYYYWIDSNTNLGGEVDSPSTIFIARYASFVGVIDDDADVVNTGYTEQSNVKLAGKWRAKNIWQPVENGGYYRLPILNTVYYTNGNTFSSDEAGNDYSSDTTGIKLGGIQYGQNTNRPITLTGDAVGMVVDFGEIAQDVPQYFYNFINTNFEYIYPNTYTIKSPTGETLAQIDEQPPIKHTNLTQAGNAYQLSITGTNDIVRTLTWEYETPTNVVFEGLGTSPNGAVIIPVGDADISIEASTILYPIFRPYRPLPDTFGVDLYKNTAEPNRVDKTNYLTNVRRIVGVMREASSVTNLTLTIQYPTYPDFNYVRITELKRFYFVNDIRLINANLYELDLEVDALMTYKTALAECVAFVDRNEFLQNPYIIDKKRVVEQGVNLETTVVSNNVFFENFDPDTEVLYVLNGYKLGTKPGGVQVPE